MPITTGIAWLGVIAGLLLSLGIAQAQTPLSSNFSEDERRRIRSLSISNLPTLPPDPSNAVGDRERAAAFGQRLFFDPGFSLTRKVSCASCHDPLRAFTDGRALAQGVGHTNRNTMSLIGASYNPWYYWDGRKDSQWSQALSPLEAPGEHGGNRLMYVTRLAGVPVYRRAYRSLFGKMPDAIKYGKLAAPKVAVSHPAYQSAWQSLTATDQKSVNTVFTNMGKALAAYQRTLRPRRTRFDDFADGLGTLSPTEIGGLKVFLRQGACLQCHNGPLFTNHDFHNTGMTQLADVPKTRGRADGIMLARSDPFNCWSTFSDAAREQCAELNFAKTGSPELIGAYKTPTLRNLSKTAPYMHAGQLSTLAEVIQHYNDAPGAPIGNSELSPLNLTKTDMQALEAFLRTLD